MDKKNLTTETVEANAILFDDRYLLLSDNVSQLPSELLIDRVGIIIIGAINGMMQLDINGNGVRVSTKEVLVVTQDSTITNIMYSQGFKGTAIIAKHELVRNLIDVNFDVLRRIHAFSEQPVMGLDDVDFERYLNYNRQLLLTLQKGSRPYHRLVLYKIFSAILYDLLGFVDPGMTCITFGGENIGHTTDGNSESNTSAQRLYKGFIEILSQSPIKVRNVEYYADRLCVSSKYLCAVVKKVSGKTPFHWINEYVMRDVSRYLFTTDLSVKEIAVKMDFPSLSFFGKYVKQHTGYSPTELRKRKEEAIIENS